MNKLLLVLPAAFALAAARPALEKPNIVMLFVDGEHMPSSPCLHTIPLLVYY